MHTTNNTIYCDVRLIKNGARQALYVFLIKLISSIMNGLYTFYTYDEAHSNYYFSDMRYGRV